MNTTTLETATLAEQVWDDPSMPLTLVQADTKERARISAMEAIATPAVIEQKTILLDRAAKVIEVTSESSIPEVIEIASLMKGMVKKIEACRKQIKEPVLRIGEAIDSIAKSTVESVNKEVKRLEDMVAQYHAEQVRKRQEEARRREEQARKEREAAEEQARLAREAAEKAKEEAEAAAKGDDFSSALEAELEAEQAAARASEAEVVAATPIYAAPVEEVAKVKGAAIKVDWDYEVINPVALYESNPACVELKPKASVIKGVIAAAAQQAGENEFHIPGLRIFPKVKVATRSR